MLEEKKIPEHHLPISGCISEKYFETVKWFDDVQITLGGVSQIWKCCSSLPLQTKVFRVSNILKHDHKP